MMKLDDIEDKGKLPRSKSVVGKVEEVTTPLMINHHENAASSQNLLIKTGRKTNYILKASQIKEELNRRHMNSYQYKIQKLLEEV